MDFTILHGWRLITRPGLKRFVILPLLANIIILGSAFWWLYGQIGEMVNWMMEKVLIGYSG